MNNNKNDQKFMAQEIRSQYMEKQFTELDELRAMDAKVKRPVTAAAYVVGTIGALVMGIGMSLTMTDIGSYVGLSDSMVPGIVIGVAGMLIAIVNYPLYCKFLKSRKKKYASEILKISQKIMENE